MLMPRQIPDCPDAPDISSENSDFTTEPFDIHVVTPLFGGGVKASENDPITVIRGSSIRGHLRFWWRATRGAAFETWKDLRKAEEEIWGSSERASKVNIQINIKNPGKSIFNYTEEKRNIYPDYALFPFQGMGNTPPKKCQENILFNLQLSFPRKYQKDIYAAIWAWINLGGIGARTRRGVGSLYSANFSPKLTDCGNSIQETQQKIQSWYEQRLKYYEIELSSSNNTLKTKDWPLVPSKISTDAIQQNPIRCWKAALDHLKLFRQGENIGRNPRRNGTPGRSRWPEPDSIRKITKKSNPDHQNPITPTTFFPRAAFGLPIQFRFNTKKSPGDSKPSDPNTYLLVPDIKNSKDARMASPMILKPLALSPTHAIGAAFNLITQFKNDFPKLKLSPVGNGCEYLDTNQSWKVMDKSLIDYTDENHTHSPYQHIRNRALTLTGGLASSAFILYFRDRGLNK